MKAAGVLMSTAGAPGLAVALTREAAAVPIRSRVQVPVSLKGLEPPWRADARQALPRVCPSYNQTSADAEAPVRQSDGTRQDTKVETPYQTRTLETPAAI